MRWLSTPVICLLLTLAALVHVGGGPVNGDAAVYQYQAARGILDERTIHAGYVAIAAALQPLAGGSLGVALDALGCLCLGLFAWAAGRLAERAGGDGRAAALYAGAALVTFAPFAEVDLPWGAALAAGTAAGPLWLAGPLLALAVSISPIALIALPWAAWTRGGGTRAGWTRGWMAAALGLVLWAPLLVWCWADWWGGPRGVLATQPPSSWVRLGLQWIRQLLLPGAMAALLAGVAHAERRHWIAAGLAGLPAFLLVRHADVPGWIPLALVAATLVGIGARRWPWSPALLWIPLALQAAAGLWQTERRYQEVRRDNDRVEALAAEAPEDAAVAASWTWGVRYGVLRTGDPYRGWISYEDALARPPARVFVLPPGRHLEGPWRWRRRADGIWYGVDPEAP